MAVDLEYYGVPPADYREQENRTRLTATAGQTTFSAPYSVGYVDVYYNGAKLDPFTEFTGTDGSNIILTVGAFATGDIIEVVSRGQVQIANIYSQQQVNNLVPVFGVATGTGDAQIVVTNPSFASYVDGLIIKLRTAGQNTTTTPVINCNAIGNKSIVSNNAGAALYGKDWVAGSEITLRYNQTLDKLILIDGNTTVITPPQFDNSNQYATTAFAQRLAGNTQGVLALTTTTTLTTAQLGSFIEVSAGTPFTITLPATSGAIAGSCYYFFNATSGTITIAANGAQTINAGLANSATYSLIGGNSIMLITDGASWSVIGGNGTASLATNGYQKLPSGMILQWGAVTSSGTSSGNASTTFPVAFPIAPFLVTTCTTGGNATISSFSLSTTAASWTTYVSSTGAITGTIGFYYMALGH